MATKIIYKENKMIISGQAMDPSVIFECGQAFRFVRKEAKYCGVAYGRYLEIWTEGENLCVFPVTQEEGKQIWENYFDLNLDYSEILAQFQGDIILTKSIEEGRGMRLLNQEPFETVLSFIISANNNVKRISKIIARLCEKYGSKIGEEAYTFPTPEQMAKATQEELRELGCGYRAPYLAATSKMVAQGEIDLLAIAKMPYEDAKRELTRLPGVGPKVADCILLYSMGKKDAFPKDVWMKRVLKNLYKTEVKSEKEMTRFVLEHFGDYAGIAQQYLFYYARKNRIIG